MKLDEIERVYREQFSGIRRIISDSEPPWLYLKRTLPASRAASILDAGCGDGAYAQKLANEGYQNVTAIDLFKHMDTGGAFVYRQAGIDATPFADEAFDGIYSLSVIFYLPDPMTGLREFHRLLHPGGILTMSMHTKYSLYTLDRIIRRACGGAQHLQGVRFYSAWDYRRMLCRAGFEVVDIDGYNWFYSPFNIVNRICYKMGWTIHQPDPGEEPLSAGKRLMKWARALTGYHVLITARKKTGA